MSEQEIDPDKIGRIVAARQTEASHLQHDIEKSTRWSRYFLGTTAVGGCVLFGANYLPEGQLKNLALAVGGFLAATGFILGSSEVAVIGRRVEKLSGMQVEIGMLSGYTDNPAIDQQVWEIQEATLPKNIIAFRLPPMEPGPNDTPS